MAIITYIYLQMEINKIISILFLSFFISVATVYGQDTPDTDEETYRDEKAPFKERLYIGGNLGLQFGTITFIDISPVLGYKFTERFSAGPGLIYQYYNFRGAGFSSYGGKVFARYIITENLFAHSEYEYLNLGYNFFTGEFSRTDVNSFFIGGGYIQRIGNRAFISVMLLYNLIFNPYSPYTNPIIRIGISAGI